MTVPEVRTERLLLRGWTDDDRPSYAAMHTDPLFMATLGPLRSRQQTDVEIDRMAAAWEQGGFGLWCLDLDGECIGFAGLDEPRFEAPFTRQITAAGGRCVEVGWRVGSPHWGRGYAPEAGAAALAFGFDGLDLDEIVSFTAATNHKSRRVMEKLGMRRDPDADFDHPGADEDSPLRPHVLYRLGAGVFRAGDPGA